MNKILALFLFGLLCINTSFAADISIIGTYTDVLRTKDGKYIKKEKFEGLPTSWNKNGNFYNAILILDKKNSLENADWNATIEIIQKDKVIKKISFDKKSVKKIGNKYFLTTFKKILPSHSEGEHTIKYSINSNKNQSYDHSMKIMEED